ncbi:hypothetical protein [Williamwhitmania taraxaci]|nr:hypothetical protein [Williamwhitmania taraxaci]
MQNLQRVGVGKRLLGLEYLIGLHLGYRKSKLAIYLNRWTVGMNCLEIV